MYELTSKIPFTIVAYPVFAILILLGIKKIYIKQQKPVEDVFSVTETNYLRGISALMVLFTHYAQVLYDPDLLYWYWFFGYLSVGFFMFMSGYAAYIQYNKKQKKLFEGYVGKRLLRLYIPFFVCNLFFIIAYRVPAVEGLKTMGLIRMATGKAEECEPVWFVWTIFLLAMIFMVSFRFLEEKKAFVLHFILTVLYIIVMVALDFGFWWYNTALAYWYGMLFAKYKIQIVECIRKKAIFLVPICGAGVLALVYYMSKGHYSFWPQSLCVLLSLVCMIYFFSMVSIRKEVLGIVGGASLELFLIQGLRGVYFTEGSMHPGYQIVICMILVILLAIILEKLDGLLYQWIIKIIYRRRKTS